MYPICSIPIGMVGSTHEILDSICIHCTINSITKNQNKYPFFPLIEFKDEIKMTWKYVLILDSGIM